MKESSGMTFAAGFITCFVILLAIRFFFGTNGGDSERLMRLQQDSANYVEYRQGADARYARLDSAYRHDTDSLTFAIDDLLRSRPSRRQPHSADADTVRARVIQRLYR